MNASAIDYCPIVKPTETEFKEFEKYVSTLYQKYSSDYGFVKVTF